MLSARFKITIAKVYLNLPRTKNINYKQMKRLLFLLLMGGIVLLSSCVSSKPCPAYSKINLKVESNG
jgi:hypothetical protein